MENVKEIIKNNEVIGKGKIILKIDIRGVWPTRAFRDAHPPFQSKTGLQLE